MDEVRVLISTRVPTMDSVRKSLGDDNWQARRDAVGHLVKLTSWHAGPVPEATIDELQRRLLEDSHWRVRREAAKALGSLGPEAVLKALPALQEACRDPDNVVRAAALATITANGQPMPPLSERVPASEPTAADGGAGSPKPLCPPTAADPAPPGAEAPEFWMELERHADEKLGVDVDFSNIMLLKITRVQSGLVSDWNAKRSPADSCEAGDYIVELNGVRGDAVRIVQVLQSARKLKALVRKGHGLVGGPAVGHELQE